MHVNNHLVEILQKFYYISNSRSLHSVLQRIKYFRTYNLFPQTILTNTHIHMLVFEFLHLALVLVYIYIYIYLETYARFAIVMFPSGDRLHAVCLCSSRPQNLRTSSQVKVFPIHCLGLLTTHNVIAALKTVNFRGVNEMNLDFKQPTLVPHWSETLFSLSLSI